MAARYSGHGGVIEHRQIPLQLRPKALALYEPVGSMKEWLFAATEYAIVMIDNLALLVVVGGTVEAAIGSMRYLMNGESGHARRDAWLRYARWLVAALTLQLAADVVESATPRTGRQ